MVEMLLNPKPKGSVASTGLKPALTQFYFSLPWRANLKESSAALNNNMTLFQSVFSPTKNKKYNSVSSSSKPNYDEWAIQGIYTYFVEYS